MAGRVRRRTRLETAAAVQERRPYRAVIGNAAYKESPLKNPVNDAKAVKAALEARNFRVFYLENADYYTTVETIDRFIKALDTSGVGMVYYAGHGVEVNNENYLVPIGARIRNETDVKYRTLSMNRLIDDMQRTRAGMNIMVVDACRDNPYTKRTRGGAKGLANVEAEGFFIAFATAPGKTARDGSGNHGLFTKHFLNQMNRKGLPLREVFHNIRQGVYAESHKEQLPLVRNGIGMGEFFFTLPDASDMTAPKTSKSRKQSTFSFSDDKPATFALTVTTEPSDATVYITNIGPKYRDGIALAPGRYDIKVVRSGYYAKTGSVDLQSDLNVKVVLQEKPKPVATQTYSKPISTASSGGTITHHGTTYGTVRSPYTGKIWLDRNLGAKRVCQSYDDEQCYGDYYQWGRGADGHENVGSSVTDEVSDNIHPKHGKFIISTESDDWDWTNHGGMFSSEVDNDGTNRQTFWSKTDGSGVCPKGFRVPTIDELETETISNGVKNRNDAFNNFLRFPSAGYRPNNDGGLRYVGSSGHIWSSSPKGSHAWWTHAWYLNFRSDNADTYGRNRALGVSVRCLKK